MLYRDMGKSGKKVSLFGFGAMRFPVAEDGSIDEAESIAMIRKAIDSGVNYIDTAYTYPKSEEIIGRALRDGYRDKVLIADKIPPFLVRQEEDKERMFSTSFERLGLDYVDFYLLHNLTGSIWKNALKWDMIGFLDQKKKEGRIGHVGFSFHDDLKLFKEIVDAYDWDMCLIQLNFMDKDFQAGEEGLRYAASKGMGVAIMEPLKGGRLTARVPSAVQEIWDRDPSGRRPVEWAFNWVASHPEVSVIQSGVSSMEQLEDDIRIFSDPAIETIPEEGFLLLDEVSQKYSKLIRYGCTGCGYCLPCTQEIDIPGIFSYYNDWMAFDKPGNVKFEYTNWQKTHASDCIGCGACEEKCPQKLPIIRAMREAEEEFGV